MSPSLKSLGFHSVPVLGLPSVMSENSSCSKMSLDISGKSLALVCELVSLSLCIVVASVFSSTSLTSYQRSRSVPPASGKAQRGLCSPSCPKRESPASVNASPSRQCGTSELLLAQNRSSGRLGTKESSNGASSLKKTHL